MLSTRQINEHGRTLVQAALVAHGIEISASAEKGIDFVVFSKRHQRSLAVKVTANEKPKPSGGRGRLHLDWWAPDKSKAEVFAFVDLDSRRIWLVETPELPAVAQQHPKGRLHFFMSVDPATRPRRDGMRIYDREFTQYLIENSVGKVF